MYIIDGSQTHCICYISKSTISFENTYFFVNEHISQHSSSGRLDSFVGFRFVLRVDDSLYVYLGYGPNVAPEIARCCDTQFF